MGEDNKVSDGVSPQGGDAPPVTPPPSTPQSADPIIPPSLEKPIEDLLGAGQTFLANRARTPKWVLFIQLLNPPLASIAIVITFLVALLKVIPFMEMYVDKKVSEIKTENNRLVAINHALENSRIILVHRMKEMEARTTELKRQADAVIKKGKPGIATAQKTRELLSYLDSYFSASGSIFQDTYQYMGNNPRKVLLWGVQGRICNKLGAPSSFDCRAVPWPEEPGEATALTFQVDPGKCVDFDLVEGRTALAPVLEPAGP